MTLRRAAVNTLYENINKFIWLSVQSHATFTTIWRIFHFDLDLRQELFYTRKLSVGCVPPLAHYTYFSNQPIDVSAGEGNSVQ